jgi:hypothetical protein
MAAVGAALLAIGLTGLLAARTLGGARAGVAAVVLIATMPLVWVAVSGAAPMLWLLPLLLAWLLSLDEYWRGGAVRWLAVSGAALAAMSYAHLAGLVFAPVYLTISVAALALRRERATAFVMLLSGFGVVAAPFVAGVIRDPDRLRDAVLAYGLYDATRFNILQGIRDMSSWLGLTVRSEAYWDHLNPAVLFLGRGGWRSTLLGSQVFLLPFAVPLALGFAAYWRASMRAIDWVMAAAFFAAPCAAALLAQPPVASRLLLIAPIAAIIAARPLARRAEGWPPPARR